MLRLISFFILICTATQLYAEQAPLRIAVTRTAYSTLVIEQLLSDFRKTFPETEVDLKAFGSLRAMEEARKGNADILITYYPPEELRLLKEGVVKNRIEFMHSTYVILGPPGDELGLLQAQNAQAVLTKMAENEVAFVASSPNGGTYQKITDLWGSVGVTPDWPWYEIANTTPLGSMRLAAEQNAYTIADLGTYILHQKELSASLIPLSHNDYVLHKPFSIMQINAKQLGQEEHPLASKFVDYVISDEGQKILLNINRDIFKAQVLFPAAHYDPGVMALRASEKLEEKTRHLNIVIALLVSLVVLLFVLVLLFVRANKYRNEQLTAEIARIAAEKANEEKSIFLSRMSHELRTPMNAILGFTQIMLLDEQSDLNKSHLNRMFSAATYLQNLIDDVLDIAILERNEVSISVSDVNVDELIQESVGLSTTHIEDKNLVVKVTGAKDCMVLADGTRIKEVLVNLISNAAKYNIDGGSITINVERMQGSKLVRISITDTGIGISEEQKGLLFKPFERLGAEYTEVVGTGIGLAITKKLVELMHGNLGFVSEKGGGSTFWVELPSAAQD